MVGVCDEFVSDGECNYATCLSLLTSIHALLIDHQACLAVEQHVAGL